MFHYLKTLVTRKSPSPSVSGARNTPAPISENAAAGFDNVSKPSVQQIHDAGQAAHDDIAKWIELWAADRKQEIPGKYRPLFSHYLQAFVQNDTNTSDQHYATLRKSRTIEILASWGYPDPAG